MTYRLTLLALIIALAACRAPDGYYGEYGRGSGTAKNDRASLDLDNKTVTLGVRWRTGKAAEESSKTLAAVEDIRDRLPPPVPHTPTEDVPRETPDPDPFGLQEGLIGGGGLALVLAAFFRDAVGLFFRRLFRMKAPE